MSDDRLSKNLNFLWIAPRPSLAQRDEQARREAEQVGAAAIAAMRAAEQRRTGGG